MKVEFLSEQGVRINEDSYLVDETQGLFAVFDGASSLTPYRDDAGRTGARVASETARDVFATDVSDTIFDTAIKANQAIESAHLRASINTSTPLNRFATTIAAIKVSHHTIEAVQIADSIVIVEYTDGHVDAPLGYHDQDLAIMRRWQELANQGHTNIRPFILHDLEELRANSNVTYGVLNGDKRAEKWLKAIELQRASVQSILLITDGLLLPKENPDTQEKWQDYIEICRQVGLQGLFNKVRSIEADDPGLTRYPRFKLHDDATGIFIRLT